MEYFVICGEKGRGKTTYIHNEIFNYLYIESQNYFNLISEIDVFRSIIDKEYGIIKNLNEYDIIRKFHELLQGKESVIIDNCELIDANILESIINQCISQNIKRTYLIFDLSISQLENNKRYNFMLKNDIINNSNDIEEYTSDISIIYQFIKNNYPKLDSKSYQNLVDYCKYNFSNIKLFMGLKSNNSDNDIEIMDSDYVIYIQNFLASEFDNLSEEVKNILNIASIIGIEFKSEILESKEGFRIFEVNQYLDEIEKMNIFIQKYINRKNDYCFLSSEIHANIYSNIKPKIKENWIKILIKYYEWNIKNYSIQKDFTEYIVQVLKLKELYINLNDLDKVFYINCHLLYKYQEENDINHMLNIITELIDFCDNNNMKEFRHSFCILKLELLMKIGDFDDAIYIIEALTTIPDFFIESNYLKYYYSFNLYNVGKVDESLETIVSLAEDLKSTSATNINEQPLYALVYGLYSTLQAHLDKDDGGKKYYKLALNHAEKLTNKSIYYSILKKCENFFIYEHSKKYLEECIDFYKKENKYLELGEVYFNLATEILFQEENKIIVKNYFEKCENIFLCFANEKSAYIENNFAIYYILEENNIEKALIMLKKVLFIKLSDFTYMTIYLNICMCYILLEKFNSDDFLYFYNKFNAYIERLMQRKNSSKYEKIYKNILDLDRLQ